MSEPFYKLFNRGTSDGVRRAWETRRNGMSAHSQPAFDKSRAALFSKTPADAKRLHLEAAVAHEKAAKDSKRFAAAGVDPKSMSLLAGEHLQHAAQHRNNAAAIKS